MRKLGPLPLAVLTLAGGPLALHNARAADATVLVALVVDTSGSVGRPGLARARRLAEGLLTALPSGGQVAVFTFDDQSRLLLERTSRPEAVRAALRRAALSGRHTALNDALYDATRYLREAGAAASAVVLITDGRDEGSALNLDDGLKLALDGRVPVFTVGVGHPDEKVLRRMAKLTGGAYAPAARIDGVTLAAQLPGVAPASTTPRATSPAAAPAPPVPGELPARQPAGPAPGPSSSGVLSRWLLGVSAVAVAAGGIWALRRRGAARPRCGGCGRALPNRLSTCAFCAHGEPAPAGETASATMRPELTPTVLARLNITEEYLDKTVTLQERPVLNVTRGPGAGRTFELSGAASLSVGRARANDIVLEDVAVSSQHCRIRPENGSFVVHDLKSTNGTFVNDRRVTHHPLNEGDVIQVGETCLQFKTERRP